MTNYSPRIALFVLAPRLRRASNRAVSIYLPARAEGYDARFYDIEFRDLMHRYLNRLSGKDQELMEYELRRLRHHVAMVRPAGCPAFAGFADEPQDATGPREGAAAADGTGHDAGATRRSHPSSRRAAADNFSASKRS